MAKKVIGLAWTEKDFILLKQCLIAIAEEEGPEHAIELLEHGFNTTTLTNEQCKSLISEIIKVKDKI